MIIDSHQHFWQYDAVKHAWINNEMQVLKRNFLPDDLLKNLHRNGVDGCVAVQADQSDAETEFLLSLAKENDFIKGVVGWVDLQAENIDKKLEQYQQNDLLKGFRHMVQDEPDEKFLLQPDFLRGIKSLHKYNFTYDILIFARHLPVTIEFASQFPDQQFVLDHLAKPEIKNHKIDAWEHHMRELATNRNMYCKVSGMVTEADWQHWSREDLKPYLDVVFDAFGPEKLMFGSDWPVCTLAAPYDEVVSIVKDYIAQFPAKQQQLIMGGNAQNFYHI